MNENREREIYDGEIVFCAYCGRELEGSSFEEDEEIVCTECLLAVEGDDR